MQGFVFQKNYGLKFRSAESFVQSLHDSVYCYYQEVCLSFFTSDYNVFTNWVARNAVIAMSLDVDTEVGKM